MSWKGAALSWGLGEGRHALWRPGKGQSGRERGGAERERWRGEAGLGVKDGGNGRPGSARKRRRGGGGGGGGR